MFVPSLFHSFIFRRLTALSNSSEDTGDCIDLELIQHINVDCVRLNKLLNEVVIKFRSLKHKVLMVLAQSLEKVRVRACVRVNALWLGQVCQPCTNITASFTSFSSCEAGWSDEQLSQN